MSDSNEHEIRILSFDDALSIERQTRLVLQMAAVERHLAGFAGREFFLSRAGKWIVHTSWKAGCAPGATPALSYWQASAILERLRGGVPIEPLGAS